MDSGDVTTEQQKTGESAARGTEDKNEAGKQDRKQESSRETRQKRGGWESDRRERKAERKQKDQRIRTEISKAEGGRVDRRQTNGQSQLEPRRSLVHSRLSLDKAAKATQCGQDALISPLTRK